LATPLFKAPVFGYFAGFAILPFLYPIFKHKFDKLKTIV
jgi:biotin transporter BioY